MTDLIKSRCAKCVGVGVVVFVVIVVAGVSSAVVSFSTSPRAFVG